MYKNTDFAPSLNRFRDYFLSLVKHGLPPQVLGEAVYAALTVRRPKVRYAIVPQKFRNWTLPRLLPARTLDRLIGKQLGFTGKHK